MHVLLSNLTAAILLAHAMLGCCWHHAHACGQAHGPLVWTSESPCSEAHQAHFGCDKEQPRHGPHGRDDCQGTKCDFIRPASASPVELSQMTCQPVVVTPPVSDGTLAGIHAGQHSSTTGVLLLPVRLHLVHQVLLI